MRHITVPMPAPYPSTFGARGFINMVQPNGFDECLWGIHEDWETISQCGGIYNCCCPGVYNYNNPPWLNQPPQGREFRKHGGIALPANQGFSTVLTFRIQPGYEGVIRGVSFNVVGPASTGFAEDSGDLIWDVSIGRSFAQGFARQRTSLGNLATPYPVVQCIRVWPGQLITMEVSRPNAIDPLDPADRIVAAIVGYTYPVHRGYAALAGMN
jgi:hypothetical protein